MSAVTSVRITEYEFDKDCFKLTAIIKGKTYIGTMHKNTKELSLPIFNDYKTEIMEILTPAEMARQVLFRYEEDPVV
ncbi:hypothetical protein [Bacillus cereus]|uniref:hypothetical protein n=1 Tax=Bacillus cereus TaxID=1396 RepID=UPI0007FB4CF8|nr:hypothetical protein [Bacillus cereus]OBW57626.1 hypothetical protein A9987_02100 [Bacillus cereus]